MNVKEFYTGKTILLTGVTGFVGTVLLEKMIRTLPEFKKLYIMIRPRKAMTIQERLENEIFSKEIFSFVQAKNPDIMPIIKRKIVPVAGDLVVNGLGMDKGARAEITRECDLIINCAASINFDDPLLDAI